MPDRNKISVTIVGAESTIVGAGSCSKALGKRNDGITRGVGIMASRLCQTNVYLPKSV
jgi:hypothetical protein